MKVAVGSGDGSALGDDDGAAVGDGDGAADGGMDMPESARTCSASSALA